MLERGQDWQQEEATQQHSSLSRLYLHMILAHTHKLLNLYLRPDYLDYTTENGRRHEPSEAAAKAADVTAVPQRGRCPLGREDELTFRVCTELLKYI